MNNPLAVNQSEVHSDKQAIANRFSRAAFTYNDVADIQARIAADARTALRESLSGPLSGTDCNPDTGRGPDIGRVPEIGHVPDIGCVLDIGCGTGRESARLADMGAEVTGLDIAPAMLEKARTDYPHITFCEGDADALPFETARFDGVFSSMALQWSECPQQAMADVARVLKPGGRAQLAIMVAGSFQELARARSEAGLTASVNSLPGALVWEKAASLTALKTTRSQVQTYTDCFDNIRCLLRSITRAGAGLSLHASNSSPLTRSQLGALQRVFPRTANDQLSLTYHVLHLSLEK